MRLLGYYLGLIGLKFACNLCYGYNRDMNIIQEFDTITAISTPLGTGGVGVIRISGEKSFEITEHIFTGKITPRMICHGWIVDGDKKVDEVVVLPFKNPNSYTGEDVIEIQCHGGINVVKNILEIVLKMVQEWPKEANLQNVPS